MTLCDAHIHVVADPATHPMLPQRTYTPPPAAIADLQRLGAPHGITRFVVVQPSFYGTDNSVTLAALETLGPNGAGIAVIDPATITQPILDRMAATRIRGLRINLYSTHGAPNAAPLAERFAAQARIAARMGWHVQVIADLAILADAAPILAAAKIPVVIDHYGLPAGHTPRSRQGRALLALAAHPHVWIKLSAPYRSTGDKLGVAPDPAWLHALLDTAPERCIWGSDWPHTPAHEDLPGDAKPAPYRALGYAAMVAAFRAAAGSAADRVMGTNPGLLYNFAQ